MGRRGDDFSADLTPQMELDRSLPRRYKQQDVRLISRILSASQASGVVSFAGGFPDPALFPSAELADLAAAASEDVSSLQYGPSVGLPDVLAWLRSRIESIDGVAPDIDGVMITSGATEALALVISAFLSPDDCVFVEAPTYLGAIALFNKARVRLGQVATDRDGMVIGHLERVLEDHRVRPRFVYTISDHQNPSGATLTSARRAHLVRLAHTFGFTILEDVAYRELSFTGSREPSLWTLGPDCVLQLGTFSKTFCPGLRLGFVLGQSRLIERIAQEKQFTDQCATPLGQRLLRCYGENGGLDRAIASARRVYRERWSLTEAALIDRFQDWAVWTAPTGGFFTWLHLSFGFSGAEFAAAALARGVAVVPGEAFFADGETNHYVRLSFSSVERDRIEDGVARLAEAARDMMVSV